MSSPAPSAFVEYAVARVNSRQNVCAEALLECYREASIFGWPCKEENQAFWDCYKRVRVSTYHTGAQIGKGSVYMHTACTYV